VRGRVNKRGATYSSNLKKIFGNKIFFFVAQKKKVDNPSVEIQSAGFLFHFFLTIKARYNPPARNVHQGRKTEGMFEKGN